MGNSPYEIKTNGNCEEKTCRLSVSWLTISSEATFNLPSIARIQLYIKEQTNTAVSAPHSRGRKRAFAVCLFMAALEPSWLCSALFLDVSFDTSQKWGRILLFALDRTTKKFHLELKIYNLDSFCHSQIFALVWYFLKIEKHHFIVLKLRMQLDILV